MEPSRLSSFGFPGPSVACVFYDVGMAHKALGAIASHKVRFTLRRRDASWRGRRRLVSSLSGMRASSFEV